MEIGEACIALHNATEMATLPAIRLRTQTIHSCCPSQWKFDFTNTISPFSSSQH